MFVEGFVVVFAPFTLAVLAAFGLAMLALVVLVAAAFLVLLALASAGATGTVIVFSATGVGEPVHCQVPSMSAHD